MLLGTFSETDHLECITAPGTGPQVKAAIIASPTFTNGTAVLAFGGYEFDTAGIAFRLDSALNGYVVIAKRGSPKHVYDLYRIDAGVATLLLHKLNAAVPDTIEIAAWNGTIALGLNGSWLGFTFDSTYTSGHAGITAALVGTQYTHCTAIASSGPAPTIADATFDDVRGKINVIFNQPMDTSSMPDSTKWTLIYNGNDYGAAIDAAWLDQLTLNLTFDVPTPLAAPDDFTYTAPSDIDAESGTPLAPQAGIPFHT